MKYVVKQQISRKISGDRFYGFTYHYICICDDPICVDVGYEFAT